MLVRCFRYILCTKHLVSKIFCEIYTNALYIVYNSKMSTLYIAIVFGGIYFLYNMYKLEGNIYAK